MLEEQSNEIEVQDRAPELGNLIDAHDRVPTGASHEVGVEQLFFSTTDALGVIDQANSVFSLLAGYSHDELVGKPHNLIRHPVMPQGAFRLMWDTLKAGDPFCAYVHNLAKNGSRYTVFATITPLGNRYLSVRSRPCREDLLGAVDSLYQAVRPIELDLRSQGVRSAMCAEIGEEVLIAKVKEAGFATYDEFIWTALPAEVKQRTELRGPVEHADCTGPLAVLQRGAADVNSGLDAWMARMDTLQDVIDSLGAEIPEITGAIETSRETATDVSNILGNVVGMAPIMLSASLWASMTSDIISILDDLLVQLEELRASCAKTRFRIALSRLHSDALSQFIEEIATSTTRTDEVLPAIIDLTRALQEGILENERQMVSNATTARSVADQMENAHGLLQVPQGLIANWRQMVVGRNDESILRLLPTIETQMSLGITNLDRVNRLAEAARSIGNPIDASPVTSLCPQMRAAAAALVGKKVALDTGPVPTLARSEDPGRRFA